MGESPPPLESLGGNFGRKGEGENREERRKTKEKGKDEKEGENRDNGVKGKIVRGK